MVKYEDERYTLSRSRRCQLIKFRKQMVSVVDLLDTQKKITDKKRERIVTIKVRKSVQIKNDIHL